jgi:hypothetical protein
MAIRLTGGVALDELAGWCAEAFERGQTECEIYVDARGWYLRAPGLGDFIIEPDTLELSSDERDPTASEVEELRAELARERLARRMVDQALQNALRALTRA